MKFNVLMVDDDSFTNELANMVIKWTSLSDHFQVEECASDAITKLSELYHQNSEKFPDYILLDLQMPEIHGFDFIREFERKFPDKKGKTYFIITTSSIMRNDKNEAFTFNSVIDYIIKPLPGDYIENLIMQGYQHNQQIKNY
jgi:two-component system, NarL family, nitrate/nitrite response regulator NarL